MSGRQKPSGAKPRSGAPKARTPDDPQRPVSGAQRPISGAQRPISGAQRPIGGAQRPISGAQRPQNGAVVSFQVNSNRGKEVATTSGEKEKQVKALKCNFCPDMNYLYFSVPLYRLI